MGKTAVSWESQVSVPAGQKYPIVVHAPVSESAVAYALSFACQYVPCELCQKYVLPALKSDTPSPLAALSPTWVVRLKPETENR
ncbi:MAG TPA: hypothetical protein VGM06_22150 [Polyangiaceae bacterium]|jgi:hypothetical protein